MKRTIFAIIVILGAVAALTTSLTQNAIADPSGFNSNSHDHEKCNADFTSCDQNGGFEDNSKISGDFSHLNCNFNTHRSTDIQKCNVQ